MRGIRNVNTCIQYLFLEIENRKAFRNLNSFIHDFTILTDSGHFVQTNNRRKYPKALLSYNLLHELSVAKPSVLIITPYYPNILYKPV
jgi:hypothetical protein